MSSVHHTQPCCDPKCNNKTQLIQGNHCCLYCRGHMHVWCGIDAPGQEEGFGQKRICSGCSLSTTSSSSSSTATSLISPLPPPPRPSSRTPARTPAIKKMTDKEFDKFLATLDKKKLPTDFTQRNADTISFNILLLQQIQKDGNLNYAFTTKKGGKQKYFDYLNEVILPIHYDPKEYQFHSKRNLKNKFNDFEKHCVLLGKTMHSTDSTGLEGESLDSDVEMYLKMAASDEVPATKKSKK